MELEDQKIIYAAASMPNIPMTDDKAIKAIKQELLKRQEELKDVPVSDQPTRARLEGEISKLSHYLSQAVGRRGKPRMTGGAVERSRSSVKHAIDRAISTIADKGILLWATTFKSRFGPERSLVYMPVEVQLGTSDIPFVIL